MPTRLQFRFARSMEREGEKKKERKRVFVFCVPLAVFFLSFNLLMVFSSCFRAVVTSQLFSSLFFFRIDVRHTNEAAINWALCVRERALTFLVVAAMLVLGFTTRCFAFFLSC